MDLKILSLGSLCTGCCACMNVCKQGAIQMLENEEGFFYPNVDFDICIECQQCILVCPECNDGVVDGDLIQIAYYGWHNDDQIRKLSSSGGAFSALAEIVLENNGVIFGSAHNYKQHKVMHQSSEDVNWAALRKSKYVQSYIGNSFQRIKKFLKDGRFVLFVGTPCQVSGLRFYLQKGNESLLTCDFICHGVPSMKILNDHLSYLEKREKSKITNVDFRPKLLGWSQYMLFCSFKNGSNYKKIHSVEPYLNGFLNNYTLRTSCYSCNYSAHQHHADFTLADFWGYRRYNPKINDEKGLSLILINTEKGKRFIEKLDKKRVTLHPIEWKYAEYVFKEHTAQNYGIDKRNIFFKDYVEIGYEKAVQKHGLGGTLKSSFKFLAKSMVKALLAK
ncbi:MAG: Coenzyme F420 hydrogenase/dehydrogenase, beta subunit C-terminal domain [Deltaproteobacteria bacterium]|nr:Coenzyme F420 hydrogenase/dehydrogenase, beta subunit C-terminal domain [Deltaproteobacteria bacterium]